MFLVQHYCQARLPQGLSDIYIYIYIYGDFQCHNTTEHSEQSAVATCFDLLASGTEQLF